MHAVRSAHEFVRFEALPLVKAEVFSSLSVHDTNPNLCISFLIRFNIAVLKDGILPLPPSVWVAVYHVVLWQMVLVMHCMHMNV